MITTVLAENVKSCWEKLYKAYLESINKESKIRSGAGAQQQDPILKDLFSKMSFTNTKISHRPGISSVAVLRDQNWSTLNSEILERQKSGVISAASDKFCRTKRKNANDIFKEDLSGLTNVISGCAKIFHSNLQERKKLTTGRLETYKEFFKEAFKGLHPNKVNLMMNEILTVIDQHKRYNISIYL